MSEQSSFYQFKFGTQGEFRVAKSGFDARLCLFPTCSGKLDVDWSIHTDDRNGKTEL